MSVVILVVYLVVLGVNYWATKRIITQAGYSPAWILAPLTPLVLTVVAFIMLYFDLRSFAYGITFGGTASVSELGRVGIVWGIDMFAIFANWILFLVFAFSRWPVTLIDSPRRGPSVPPPPGSAPQYEQNPPGPSRPSSSSFRSAATSEVSSPPSSTSGATDDRTRDAPTAVAAPATSAGQVRIKHCVWCGEALPGSRALFHECGSKDRPATNCAACGALLPNEGAACTACSSVQ
ncbi:MAG TPA: hypothetical protein VG246_07045 [Acidimicrobiales bacterium]|nr:hypothetical protein [Acidimicrobiales bacterium]